MAFATAPSTPERAPGTPFIRRAFTAPIKLARQAIPSSEPEAQGAETLFAHNTARIVSFTTSTGIGRRHSSVTDSQYEFGTEEPAGTLPWASLTERTIAAGPLRIYRVLGSVAFLNSGTTLHPILAKSQCWCVDGVSKFVLRIRGNNYYRIELPDKTDQDKEQVERLKSVLGNVLQYEKTMCPFKRGFTVDLPEPPQTPIKKKAWTPKAPPASLAKQASEIPEDFGALNTVDEEIKQSRSDNEDETRGVDEEEDPIQKIADYPLEASDVSSIASVEVGTDVEQENSQSFMKHDEVNFRNGDTTPLRPRRIMPGRTVTAPPQLSLHNSPPSISSQPITAPSDPKEDSSSVASSVDSFRSFHSPISPLAPSPKSSPPLQPFTEAAALPRIRTHRRDESDATITTDSHGYWDLTGPGPDPPRTPTLASDASSPQDIWDEIKTPSPPGLRVRRTLQKRRAQSPLPSSTNLYTPYSPHTKVDGHHLTAAILQRTCSFLLGPPAQLVALMMRIAARITRGTFQGSAVGVGDAGQRIPCSWDFSSDGSDDHDDVWEEEDDYGVSLGKTMSGKDVRTSDVGGSWEID